MPFDRLRRGRREQPAPVPPMPDRQWNAPGRLNELDQRTIEAMHGMMRQLEAEQNAQREAARQAAMQQVVRPQAVADDRRQRLG